MKRYTAETPKSAAEPVTYDDDFGPLIIPHLTVYEEEGRFVPTGILGPDGRRVMAWEGPEPMMPIGFLDFDGVWDEI